MRIRWFRESYFSGDDINKLVMQVETDTDSFPDADSVMRMALSVVQNGFHLIDPKTRKPSISIEQLYEFWSRMEQAYRDRGGKDEWPALTPPAVFGPNEEAALKRKAYTLQDTLNEIDNTLATVERMDERVRHLNDTLRRHWSAAGRASDFDDSVFQQQVYQPLFDVYGKVGLIPWSELQTIQKRTR